MNHVLFLVLKACQNPNPGDAKQRDISSKHPSHQSKKVKDLDTVFNIQTIGYYSFQGSHPICCAEINWV